MAVPRDRDSPPTGRGEANVPVTAGEPGREEGETGGNQKRRILHKKLEIPKIAEKIFIYVT